MTIIANGRHVPIATLRKHLGKKVRWEKRGQNLGMLYYPGTKGVGVLTEAIGRNLHVDDVWLWRPDLLLLETVDSAPEEIPPLTSLPPTVLSSAP